MAQIQSYAEAVGMEEVASPLAARDVIDLPATRPDGTPWNFDGRLASEVLAEANGDYFAIELSPSTKLRLGELEELSDQVRRILELGFVEVSVAHLHDLPGDTRVRVGYRVSFTDEEIRLLAL